MKRILVMDAVQVEFLQAEDAADSLGSSIGRRNKWKWRI